MKIMKTIILLSVLTFGISGCKDYSGTFTGYAWKDEAKGISLEESTEKIETKLTLDSQGVITGLTMDFLVKDKEGNWYSRLDTSVAVAVDYTVNPTPATPEATDQPYKPGKSMFTLKAADKMSLYALGVSENGTVALALVEPMTRYQFEYKFSPGYNFSQEISGLTIGSGLAVPTIRTSSGGLIKPKTWSEFGDKTILDFYKDPYVLTGRGVLKGLTRNSNTQEMLEKLGVLFIEGKPQPLQPQFGFTSMGGWSGNYAAIQKFMAGKKAFEVLSLVDWTIPRYAGGINADNFFGIDAKAGATKTVQNSADGIAGATVRMSRESSSYQRALVAAGILEENQVIRGRF